jgi:hypothetical protein
VIGATGSKRHWAAALILALFATSPSFIESSIAATLSAEQALEKLETKGRAPKTGYDRDLYGTPWSDVDRNGCDTRNDILNRDLATKVFTGDGERCTIIEGVLVDPYSGERIEFVRGRTTSLAVQIDHVVSLSNAWQTGAFRWSSEKLKKFANDPLNLMAVKGALNSQKGDGDAATWLPPKKSYRCKYVARQIAVKVEYQLWVTKPEGEAMKRILVRCHGQKLPSN